ncbi:MAG: fumarylacetoacetate hydrolase family protein [Ardenticatenaceae bacterium]|nr:fumarylacetoacetate hydrolase family protein [Ardenticatenaceae bacterium]
MKLVTYQLNGVEKIGAVTGAGVVDLTAVSPTMLGLIEMGAEGLAQARDVVAGAETAVSLADITLLAPIPVPRRNLMCVGKNYLGHVEEIALAQGLPVDVPELPLIFNKATTTVNAPYGDIPYFGHVSTHIDWEAELVVIIGKQGRGIAKDDARSHVFGYTVLNDVTARDVQRKHKQFFVGKSFDGSAPLGPWIVTADEVADPQNLRVTCHVNGVLKQNGNTQKMIFGVDEVIHQLSKAMTLLPGDIIATGTPDGVGVARTPPEFLKPGDVVETEVEGVGALRNVVVAVD